MLITCIRVQWRYPVECYPRDTRDEDTQIEYILVCIMAKRKRTSSSTNRASRNLPQPSHTHPVISLYYRQILPLRLYLLRNLPGASKVRRRRIASLGVSKCPDTDSNLVRLLDTTLVGVVHESPTVESQRRCRDLLAFTQSQSQSQLESTCTQTEVCPPFICTIELN